ncbi:C39 family peptidase [Synechococcus sp. JA-2-3B'a(2-13)]|uniref:C39 family peptidase n=1 Tax=Synechococcus sp. (strain JA-2-3B'a(2-13)) TaxID=321332 RepID=UPI0002F34F4A|nr:C39 family peptidase [Synechococcus sp. JA-2-3B'a(2-13)]
MLLTMQAQTHFTYRTGFQRWRAGEAQGFQDWSTQGICLNARGQLVLDPEGLRQEVSLEEPEVALRTPSRLRDNAPHRLRDRGRPFYPLGPYWVGEATSPAVPTSFPMVGAIASWNATTPPGTWLELWIRAKLSDRWTKWYHGGVWAADPLTLASHSVQGQGDEDGNLYTDLLVLKDTLNGAEAFQVRVRLFTQEPGRSAVVDQVAVAISNEPVRPSRLSPGDPSRWGKILDLPWCSQMVYPDGGEVWCSPTSLAMVMAYWKRDPRPCEVLVRAAVAGVYDRVYQGHGNWAFNVAHAAEQGLSGVVARLESLAQAEAWIAAGVPVVLSYAWGEGELEGAPIPRSNGHLAVLVGFARGSGAEQFSHGDPILHDPAAKTNEEVRRTYRREQLESLWLEHSGGTVYLIHPREWPVPTL